MENRNLMQNALQQLRDLRGKLKAVTEAKTEPIAIVGMGCRFPGGVENPDDFWQLLSNGIDAITEIPSERWDVEKFYHPEPGVPGKISSRHGGFIGNLQEFDADFFGISPREAVSIDPQQRILLEVAWEALENAGMIPEQLAGTSTGVFIGISSNDYSSYLLNRPISDIDAYLATGNSHSTAAGRLSYTLGFTGPCLAVDTACSSSLVAVHLACQSLRNRECDIAIVGGVNRILSPEFTINFSQARMLAADGRCKTFDASADGFVRSEGCGIIILQRLGDARTTNRPIQALIRGSAINQDGRSGGLTVPNGPSQQAVIRQALANSLVNPADITYIEAHGTGTALGDPIEIGALGAVFADSHTPSKPLFVGSTKTNIGHLEAAAGIAGLIKVVLALKHQQIPPHMHFHQPNPHIAWENLPISIPTTSTTWNSQNQRLAGVSSFGFSGTNAHVVLEQALHPTLTLPLLRGGNQISNFPPLQGGIKEGNSTEVPPLHLLTLSAKNAIALKQLARRFANYLSEHPDISWADVCFTANTGRSLFAHRLALITDSLDNACVELNNFADGKITKAVISQVNYQVEESSTSDENLPYLPSLGMEKEEWQVILTNIADLYGRGVRIDWQRFYAGYQRQLIDLPNYPFQRQRYWVDVDRKNSQRVSEQLDIHPLLGQQLNIAKSNNLYFEQQSCNYPLYLLEHQVFTQVVLPGAAYLEIALAVGKKVLGWNNVCVKEVSFLQTCVLDDIAKVIQVVLIPNAESYEFEIVSAAENNWITHAIGELSFNQQNIKSTEICDFQEKQSHCNQITDIPDFYQKLKQVGIDYGESFQAINQLWYGENQALAEIRLPPACQNRTDYIFHPVVLDACLQTIAAIFSNQPTPAVYLPIGLDNLQIWESVGENLWSWVKLRCVEQNSPVMIADIEIFNPEGKIIGFLNGLQLKTIEQQNLLTTTSSQDWREWLYEVEWRNQPHFIIQEREIGDLLPSPEIIAQHLAPKFSELLNQPEIQTYAELLPQLETLSIAYVVQVLQALGLTFAPGENFSEQQFIKEVGIVRSALRSSASLSHEQLFSHLLQILASAGILQRHDDLWCVRKSPDLESPQIQQVRLRAKYALAMAELKLLERCATHLVEILQGKCQPLQVLFPSGDLTTLTQLYQDSPGAKVMNTLVQQAVIAAIEKLPPGKTIRIIEIGGGTGGTTASLLPQLVNYSVEYIFTDISPLFLTKAQQQFSEYPFVSYQSLNIEHTISSQGLNNNSFDIVIAANVIHATSDLNQTITHVKSLLINHGLLILLEGTRPSAWLDLIFGLTEGWWSFRDKDLRPDYPLISTEQWQNLLNTHGFTRVNAIKPECELPLDLSQQTVIIAQSENQEEIQKDSWLIVTENQEIAKVIQSQNDAFVESIFYQDKQQLTLPEKFLTNVIYISHVNNSDNHKIPQLCYQESTQLLKLVQTLIKTQNYPTNLWIVTQGAVDSTLTTTGLIQSPLWGIAKVIRLEHPELNCRCIDLEPHISLLQQIDTLLIEINNKSEETQIIHHTTGRKVARLTRFNPPPTLATPQQPYRLTINQRGNLDSLQWEATSRRQPQAGEVEICVCATGLNFIDVLDAVGLLSFDRNWFGVECAGEIVAVGEDVTQFAVGDAVVALAPDSFSQYVTINAHLVVPKPAQLSFTEVATIPANFITAEYALHQVARMKPGMSILIHAAASGTGMAAVQIAQQAGLEVFATASPQKWDKLENLGVKHLFNSRNLDFSQQILAITNGEGVDIVLNSLSGDFIPASLKVLKTNGHLIEIGKRGVWNTQQVSQVKPNVRYDLVDLMSVAQQQPQLVQHLLQRLMSKFQAGELQPLPQTIFSTENLVAGFRMMQQARHTGKIVITHESQPLVEMLDSIHSQATYLITGGMGGLGLEVADWLARKGAKYLVLVGRTMPEAAQTRILALQTAGVTVTAVTADVTQPEQLAEVFATIHQNFPPLRGVVHAAGILDDGVLQQLNPERLQQVMAVKISGAWNLHILTQNTPLDYFIMFSSAASLFGSPGQANHVAANTFLDTLAAYRHSQGLPALSINWGVWSDIGAAAKRGIANQMSMRGVSVITPSQGIEILEYLKKQTVTQVGVIPVNWSELLKKGHFSTFFADFHTQTAAKNHQTSGKINDALALAIASRREGKPTGDIALLTNYLQTEVGKILGLSTNQLPDTQVGFFDMGMDSLMMVELRSRVESSLNRKINSTILFEHPTIDALAQHLAREILAAQTEPSQIVSGEDDFTSEQDTDIDNAIAKRCCVGEASLQTEAQIALELEALERLLKND
jgi:acyl transferase domain-containing protein/NADPH:quinone reductase-like Zn-dependent oxidoreductase/NAD(P)-dependent dehydrogenase (short-subunit alcohol dehydrogenase family)/SAM-dependent methyltransferase/acyl carrier protein